MRKFANKRGECQFGFFSWLMIFLLFLGQFDSDARERKTLEDLTQVQGTLIAMEKKIDQLTLALEKSTQKAQPVTKRAVEKP